MAVEKWSQKYFVRQSVFNINYTPDLDVQEDNFKREKKVSEKAYT